MKRTDEPTYRINVAAELSGVSETLIRAWERRYGVPRPKRTSSGYRTYARSEIELLKRLKELTERGMSIGEAAQLVPSLSKEVRANLEHDASPHPALRYEPWRDDVLHAAQRFDQPALEKALQHALEVRPPLVFFDDFITPLMREVGNRWHAGTLSVAEEHLISNAVRERLLGLLAHAPRRAKHHVICACPPEESHELGLLGAALRFRHEGWSVTYLGARTPLDQLAHAVTALEPELVALSVMADGRELKGLEKALPAGTRIVVGGAAARRAPHALTVVDDAGAWTRLLGEFT